MNIVTGYTGTPHVTSNAQQGFNQGVLGTGNYVLDVGEKFDAALTDATTVTLSDGEGVMQGVHFRIEPGTTEAVAISPGTTGYNRIDLICARYTKDAATGIENVSLVVVEGAPNASTPSEPSYNTGDILNGETPVDCPLWKVTLSGLTPSLARVAGVISAISTIGSSLNTLLGKAVTLYKDESSNGTITMVGSASEYSGSLEKTYSSLPAGQYLIFVGFTLAVGSTDYIDDIGSNLVVNSGIIAANNNATGAGVSVSSYGFISSNSTITVKQQCGCVAATSGNRNINTWMKAFKIG